MTIGPRLRKEALVLFWPWCAVMLALGGVMLWHFFYTIRFWDEVLRTGAPVLGLGSVYLAALSFGTEFQSRTLPMLLSQPCSRLRLWSEKMLLLTCFLLPLLLAYPVWREIGGKDDWSLLSEACLALALACSTSYWTLFARSSLGGMMLSIAALGALMLNVTFWVGKLWAGRSELVDGMTPFFMSMSSLSYALLFLWLGWLKFFRLELNTADGGESGLNATAGNDVPVASVLRNRAGSPLGNLLRKELRLQRPLLVFALMFALFWLALTGLVALQPSQRLGTELLLETVTGIYLVICPVLAGCLPLCEERALGIHQSNLTLPVAIRTQWLLKLGLALLLGGLAGVALPAGLAVVTNQTLASPLLSLFSQWSTLVGTYGRYGNAPPSFIEVGPTLWLSMATLGLLILLGFWSATMISRVTHAVLLTVVAFIGLITAVHLGIWGGFRIPWLLGFADSGFFWNNSNEWRPTASITGLYAGWHSQGAFMDLMTWISAHFQIPLSVWIGFAERHANYRFLAELTILTATLMAGAQAWRHFRVPPRSAKSWMWAMGRLAGGIMLVSALAIIALKGIANLTPFIANSSLVTETQAAVRALKLPPLAEFPRRRIAVSFAELEATGQLSAQTKAWLINAKLEIYYGPYLIRREGTSTPVIRNAMLFQLTWPSGYDDRLPIGNDVASPSP